MMPAALSRQLEAGLADFLRLSFWSGTPGMTGLVDRLLDQPGAVLKGPYVSVNLPFVQGAAAGEPFPKVPLGFPPHAHQERAFERLSRPVRGDGTGGPVGTLVATGTGSGKTESFLWPILEHCRQKLGQPGIKAILIYPMNALATDQAQRIAKAIHRTPALKGGVRAGLYIGEGRDGKSHRHGTMGEDHVITDREVLQRNPPDILLTNYKMLDYLLIRPKDQPLWQHNHGQSLRYLVVDELHTFDGAQGTDLACLIRRLKARLGVQPGRLCCVGTSATLGSGVDAEQTLRTYASRVFGERFDARAVVSEQRQDPSTFFAGSLVDFDAALPVDAGPALDPSAHADADAYLIAQQGLWFDPLDHPPLSDAWRVALGQQLAGHAVLRNLVQLLQGEPLPLPVLCERLGQHSRTLRQDPDATRLVLTSFLSLVSAARSWLPERPQARLDRDKAGRPRPTRPFLEVRLQLWQRELNRMVATVGREPVLAFSDDLAEVEAERHLPVVHCRECGAMGWAANTRKDKKGVFRTKGLQSFYRKYFANDPDVVLLWPAEGTPLDGPWKLASRFDLHTPSLTRLQSTEGIPDEEVLAVVQSHNTATRDGKLELTKDCPYCASTNSLTLVGFRAATLTAVYIDQLFASRFNDDKKLLTFSDSVQDAAHRAGFFGARTWRFNLRVATQQVLQGLDRPHSLAELARAVPQHWRERLGDTDFVASFLPPNMDAMRDYEHLVDEGSLPPGSNLPDFVARRIAFELYGELGIQARIGRSLPRTGCASVRLDPARLDAACAEVLPHLREQIGGLRELSLDQVRALVVGSLHHLRVRGGILHGELPNEFIEKQNVFAFNRMLHLPSFGPKSRLPSLLTNSPKNRHFHRLITKNVPGSFYEATYRRIVAGMGGGLTGTAGDALPLVISALVTHGLLLARDGAQGTVWGLSPEALVVVPDSTLLSCDRCRHWVRVAPEDVQTYAAVPCLNPTCGGHYAPGAGQPQSHFGALYRTGDVQRVYAAEHTGLLQRGEREEVETRFKAEGEGRELWFPNLLSCTSTLEMGIDIGTLSSAILCSVPPTQANYLQRIGRAGRRDGNSLLLTVATGRPHDLYFFERPADMLAGEVEAPGIYLRASAVLERQLAAFTLDQWNAEGVPPDAIPGQLAEVFDHLPANHSRHFPHTWRRFLSARGVSLLDDFVALFASTDEALSDDVIEHLRVFLMGDADREGSLEWKLMILLHGEKKSRDGLVAQHKLAVQALDELKNTKAPAQDHDDRVRELEDEIAALAGLIKSINTQQTLDFLTTQGLLPNYAFPESPIRLRSVIYRRKAQVGDTGKGKYETRSYEYARPGMSGITELAPMNQFYAGGRRVRIDQIDVKNADIETWRFCAVCSHSQRVGTDDDVRTSCPSCSSPAWGEDRQKHELLRLQQAFAKTPDHRSRIRDEAEERQPRFYNRNLLITISTQDLGAAWSTQQDKTPFAFEYVRLAHFREFNYGEATDQGTKFSIAGREEVRQGFAICRHCGKVQPRPPKAGKAPAQPEHTIWCPAREKGSKQADNYQSAVFLYREFKSEAIRLLLPLSTVGGDQQRNSFVAAFQLGLRDKYGGQVDHIRTAVYSEPEEGTHVRRQYLVLHDTVPGGTGYLKDLMVPEGDGDAPIPALMDILRRAIHRIDHCSCASDETKDGCYRCVFAYRNSRDMRDTSASTARTLFARILHDAHKLERIDGLSSISVSGLMDSVLEARFIEALRQTSPGGQPLQVEKRMVRDKPGYLVRAAHREWLVEPQVELGPPHGISEPVSIDFVFRELRALGEDAEPANDRKIAIFLDGFAFHRDRVGKDLHQRMHLLDADYDVWHFTWQDVDAAFHVDVEEPEFLLHPDLEQLRGALVENELGPHQALLDKDPLHRFADALNQPTTPWSLLATVILATQLDFQADKELWWQAVQQRAPKQLHDALRHRVGEYVGTHTGEGFGLWFRLDLDAGLSPDAVTLIAWLDDRKELHEQAAFRKTWRGFLHAVHALRALPNAWFLSSFEQDKRDYAALLSQRDAPSEADHGPWDALAKDDDLEADVTALMERLADTAVPVPTLWGGLPDAKGWDTGVEAALYWEERRVAVVDEDTDIPADLHPGWTVLRTRDLADPSALVDALAAGAR